MLKDYLWSVCSSSLPKYEYRKIRSRAINVDVMSIYSKVRKYELKSIEVSPFLAYSCSILIFKQ